MSEASTVDGKPPSRAIARPIAIAGIGLALLPFLALGIKVYHYGLYFPYWDAWHFSLFLEKARVDGLGFADFWAQHNEHRPIFPRLLMFLLATLSGWNVAWELAVNVLMSACTFLLLCRLAFRGSKPDTKPWPIVPLFSFLVFSWVQMENWVWGWQMEVFMSTLALVAGVVLLSGVRFTPLRFALALGAGIVASYSFANGLLFWFALAPLVAFAPALKRQARLVYSLLWVAVAACALQLYFFAYHKPDVSPSLSSIFQAPLQFIGYVVIYLGAPVTGIVTPTTWHGVALPVGPLHYLAGIGGLVALAVLARLLPRRRPDAYHAALPWLGLVLYVLGSAAITAAGRAGMGLEQAMTSRYTTISTLYWCALAGLLLQVVQDSAPNVPSLSAQRKHTFALIGVLLFGGALFLSHRSQRQWEQVAHWKRMGWEALRAGHEAPLYLQDLCWDPAELRDRFLPILREGHWAGFGGEPEKPPAMADAYVAEAEHFMAMGLLGQAKTYLETALFFDNGNEQARARYGELRKMVEGAK